MTPRDPFVYQPPNEDTAPRYELLRAHEAAVRHVLRNVVEPLVDPNVMMVGAGRLPIQEDFSRINAATKEMYDRILSICPESVDKETALTKVREARMWANEALVASRVGDAFTPRHNLQLAYDALTSARMWACASVALSNPDFLPILSK